MINRNHINPLKAKLRANKVNYRTISGPYSNTHDAEVTFRIPESYSIKIITHRSYIDNEGSVSGFVYDTIIGHDLILQLFLKSDFGIQILEWDETVVPMKDPGNFLGKPNLTKNKM